MALVLGGLALFFADTAPAQDLPDVEYGLWETTTVTTVISEAMSLPESTNTTTECVTEEDVREGQAFLQDQEDCDILEQTMTSSSMDVTMVCRQPESGEVLMNVSMRYEGDTMTGSIDGEMEGPMGKMSMNITMEGRRIGDC